MVLLDTGGQDFAYRRKRGQDRWSRGSCDALVVRDRTEPDVVRWRGDPSAGAGLAALLADYHLCTEEEKGTPVATVADLPERYRFEVADPGAAFAGDEVLVAWRGGVPVGCLVLTAPDADGRAELKRLWTDPGARGGGVASCLLAAALARAPRAGATSVGLSVWSWRRGAITLYERFGFAGTESWDERPDLVCMERVV